MSGDVAGRTVRRRWWFASGIAAASIAAALALGGGRPPPAASCDAGNEAFVRRVVPVVVGRHVLGRGELGLLVSLAAREGRAAVVDVLAALPEYVDRWSDFFMDDLQVNRAGARIHDPCYSAVTRPGDRGEVADWVRTHPPTEPFPERFTMADVLHSSLRLDDVTPTYRAHLFAMLNRPVRLSSATSLLDNEMSRRRNFGAVFFRTYLHRDLSCLSCHSSEESVIDSDDPLEDRHWPIEGPFDSTLLGDFERAGNDATYAAFRRLGLVTTKHSLAGDDEPKFDDGLRDADGISVWGLSDGCGRFVPERALPADPAGFARLFGDTGSAAPSVWKLERLLDEGIRALSGPGSARPSAASRAEAFASMLAARVANQVWREVHGRSLTVDHFFPRNQAQRDRLGRLATVVLSSGWSLRALLKEIVLDDAFNRLPASAGCGAAYPFEPVFNPWADGYDEPEERRNGVGDLVHRWPARTLVRAASFATSREWAPAPRFPSAVEAHRQASIGAFVDDHRQGFDDFNFQAFLEYENSYGSCAAPSALRQDAPPQAGEAKTGAPGHGGKTTEAASCVGRCGVVPTDRVSGCACDDSCAHYGDCCEDFVPACREGVARPLDFVDDLLADARRPVGFWRSRPSVADLVGAVRDRILAQPALDAAEAKLVAGLLGVERLDVPAEEVSDLEAGLRAYCGVLLRSPQFVLSGLDGEAARNTSGSWPEPAAATCGRYARSLDEVRSEWRLDCEAEPAFTRRPMEVGGTVRSR